MIKLHWVTAIAFLLIGLDGLAQSSSKIKPSSPSNNSPAPRSASKPANIKPASSSQIGSGQQSFKSTTGVVSPSSSKPRAKLSSQAAPKSDIVQVFGQSVFVDPDIPFITIGKIPGIHPGNCDNNQDSCIVIPNSDVRMVRTPGVSLQSLEVVDLNELKQEKLDFAEVEYQYSSEDILPDNSKRRTLKKGKGWIDYRFLYNEPLNPIFRTESEVNPLKVTPEAPATEPLKPQAPVEATPKCPESCADKNRSQIGAITKQIEKEQPKSTPTKLNPLEQSVEAIRSLVGRCPVPNPHKGLPRFNNTDIIYDKLVLPKLEEIPPRNLPLVSKENPTNRKTTQSQRLTQSELVNIDAIARTIYSEVTECYRFSPTYAMASAKTLLNREKLYELGAAMPHYVHENKQKEKPVLAMAANSPWQYSVWNPANQNNPKDKTTHRALCPPTEDDSSNNWSGRKPTNDDKKAWDMALKIATEAVLFRKSFVNKTQDVTQTYYTSKRDNFLNKVRANPAPKIQGRKIESFNCMYLWEEPSTRKRDRLKTLIKTGFENEKNYNPNAKPK